MALAQITLHDGVHSYASSIVSSRHCAMIWARHLHMRIKYNIILHENNYKSCTNHVWIMRRRRRAHQLLHRCHCGCVVDNRGAQSVQREVNPCSSFDCHESPRAHFTYYLGIYGCVSWQLILIWVVNRLHNTPLQLLDSVLQNACHKSWYSCIFFCAVFYQFWRDWKIVGRTAHNLIWHLNTGCMYVWELHCTLVSSESFFNDPDVTFFTT